MKVKSSNEATQSRKKSFASTSPNARLLSLAIAAVSLILPSQASAEVTYDEHPALASEVNLPVCEWNDKALKPKAAVLMLHGISQRAYTLRTVANSLASQGFLTYGMDLRGHGWWHKQEKCRDGYRSNYKASQADVTRVLKTIKEENPDIPLYLIGESVGSAVALRAANDSPEVLKGLVLCGAGSKPGRANMLWLLTDMTKCMFRKPVNIVRYQKKYGTDDLVALQQTIDDPDQRKTFSFREILSAKRFLGKNRKFAQKLDPRISVLVVHGACDKTLTPKSAKKVFSALNTFDKKLVMVPDCGHILLGTPAPKPMVTYSITSFIDDHATQRVASVDGVEKIAPEATALTLPAGGAIEPGSRSNFRHTSIPIDTLH
jgi:acylglycerol lipase